MGGYPRPKPEAPVLPPAAPTPVRGPVGERRGLEAERGGNDKSNHTHFKIHLLQFFKFSGRHNYLNREEWELKVYPSEVQPKHSDLTLKCF